MDRKACTIEHGGELVNALIVPGRCHDYGADAGLSDVPAWAFCQPSATTGGDLPALRRAA